MLKIWKYPFLSFDKSFKNSLSNEEVPRKPFKLCILLYNTPNLKCIFVTYANNHFSKMVTFTITNKAFHGFSQKKAW